MVGGLDWTGTSSTGVTEYVDLYVFVAFENR